MTNLIVLVADTDYDAAQFKLHAGVTYEELLDSMKGALDTDDGFAKTRNYEVIEVQVIRRATVVREVERTVSVSMTVTPQPADAEQAAA